MGTLVILCHFKSHLVKLRIQGGDAWIELPDNLRPRFVVLEIELCESLRSRLCIFVGDISDDEVDVYQRSRQSKRFV